MELPTSDQVVLPAAIANIWTVGTSRTALIAGVIAEGLPPLSSSTDTLRASNQIWQL